jgi:hypothetical protein
VPSIPQYGGPQVQQRAASGEQFAVPQAPDIGGQQAQRLSHGVAGAGRALSSIQADMQERANATRHDDATNQLVDAATTYRIEALQLKGKNALERPDGKSLPDEYGEKLDQARDRIAETLGNDAQREAFKSTAAKLSTQFRAALAGHMVQQQDAYADDTYKGTVDTASNQGALLYGDPETRQQSRDVIRRAVDNQALRKGWDDKTREDEFQHAISPMHAGIIQSLIKGGRAPDAQAYYDANSAEMSIQTRASLQGVLHEAVAAQKSDAAVEDVWGQIGPRSANDPVRIFDMEQALHGKFKDDPDALKRSVSDLRSKAQGFNAQQAELKAGNISAVWQLIDSGTGLSAVQRSDAWLAMDGADRHKIREALEAEAATRESRAAAVANRQAANASRQLSQMHVAERMAYMRNGDQFLTVSDPEVLKNMSRAQVEALRSDFGMEPTQHLLQKWDTLQKPGKLVEAKIDRDDFNQIADEMGLDPFAKNKGEEAKRALGTLQFRIEQLIDSEQAKAGKPLDRQAKMDLVRKEMARTVTVNPGWYAKNQQVPVIQLSNEQALKVVIPSDEHDRLMKRLRSDFEKSKDASTAPTEENVRKHYLRSRSISAKFIE